jgi:hypothetical protein
VFNSYFRNLRTKKLKVWYRTNEPTIGYCIIKLITINSKAMFTTTTPLKHVTNDAP